LTLASAGSQDRGRAPLILAHRGDWSAARENSLAAFGAAAARPDLDGVEFDIRLARDGTPMVSHDVDLQRVHGVDAQVGELSAAELTALGVSTLASVLDVLPEPSFLDVELKEPAVAEVIPLLARLRGQPPRRAVVSSFRPGVLASMRRLAPAWPTWLIHRELDERVVATARSLGCVGIAAQWPSLDATSIGLVRAAGLQLATWTVEDPDMFERVRGLDVDVICVDPGAWGAVGGGEAGIE
jgi:glycerophosphoryl diester phosphodiesterase